MLKYIALIKVYENFMKDLDFNHHFFKSPVTTDKTVAVNWLNSKLKQFPDAAINEMRADKKYNIFTTIIAYDYNKCENIDIFLDKFINF